MGGNQLNSPVNSFPEEHYEGKNNIRFIPDFDFKDSNIRINDLISESQRLTNKVKDTKEHKGLFLVRTANRCMEEARAFPVPRMLFGEYWFESELCILFADTNLGKSILGVQIGDSISKSEHIPGFRLESLKQLVLYFDFELSDKQFENRYSDKFEHPYQFDDNFIRVEIDPDAEIPGNQTFEDYLGHSLERSIVETGAKVLIIDWIRRLN